jgi:hypothetical protein
MFPHRKPFGRSHSAKSWEAREKREEREGRRYLRFALIAGVTRAGRARIDPSSQLRGFNFVAVCR